MNRLVISITLLLFALSTHACSMDPWYRVAKNYESFLEKADVVFLGKLESFEEEGKYDQIATFTVIKGFKSELNFGASIEIKNHVNSSCSRPFYPTGSAFYVFANNTDSGGYVIDGYATFVPMSVALEVGMGLN